MKRAGGIGAKLDRIEAKLSALERLADHLDNANLPLAMSKSRAAREIDVSVTQLRRLIQRGDIRLTRHRKVPASELLRYAMTEGRRPVVSKAEKYSGRVEAEKLRKWQVP